MKTRAARVSVVGLGHVGRLGIAYAACGSKTVSIDIDDKKTRLMPMPISANGFFQ
jgi:UDP-N-acetyl-D-mannosaminuronate dehydrogenase